MIDVVPDNGVTDEPEEYVVTLWVHTSDYGAVRKEMRMVARTDEWAAEVASAWASSTTPHVVAVEVVMVDLARCVDAERREAEEAAAEAPRRDAWWVRVARMFKTKTKPK